MAVGRLVPVDLREVWKREEYDLTPWLEKNISVLEEALNIRLTIERREHKVGPFEADLYGQDGMGNRVIIENQLETTDHNHLGQLMTYFVNLEAKTAIWITSDVRYQHRRVVEWLNEVTPNDVAFYLAVVC